MKLRLGHVQTTRVQQQVAQVVLSLRFGDCGDLHLTLKINLVLEFDLDGGPGQAVSHVVEEFALHRGIVGLKSFTEALINRLPPGDQAQILRKLGPSLAVVTQH